MTRIYVLDRRIVLPQELDGRLKTLAGLSQETSGVLLYESQRVHFGLDLMVNTLYMTGRGKLLEVGINPNRKAIIDDFLYQHPDYKFIEWHTHVTGNRGLSEDDRKHYAEELSEDPYFIAMIVTDRRRTIIKSKNSVNLRTVVVPTSNEFYAREEYLQQELQKSAKKLGLNNLPKLKATRS